MTLVVVAPDAAVAAWAAAVEARVTDCKDAEQLDTWAERVLTAASLEEVFG